MIQGGKHLNRKGLVIGIILLFLVSAVPFHTEANDEIRDPPQSAELYFLKYAFVWGTYEHRWKDWLLSFEIWNENTTDLTIHVIGYWVRESCYVHIEAHYVRALRHLGIIGPHSCCIFAFGLLTVDGTRQ